MCCLGYGGSTIKGIIFELLTIVMEVTFYYMCNYETFTKHYDRLCLAKMARCFGSSKER